MFPSLTIIREPELNLAKVIFILKYSVKLRRYLLGSCVGACHRMACVLYAVHSACHGMACVFMLCILHVMEWRVCCMLCILHVMEWRVCCMLCILHSIQHTQHTHRSMTCHTTA